MKYWEDIGVIARYKYGFTFKQRNVPLAIGVFSTSQHLFHVVGGCFDDLGCLHTQVSFISMKFQEGKA